MKRRLAVAFGWSAVLLFAYGCEQSVGNQPASKPFSSFSLLCAYVPASINITPLTEFVRRGSEESSKLKVSVDLLDEFDSRIKAPCVFRFELYEYEPRSNEPKGKRIYIWPDIDLTNPRINNTYWQDYLRTYEFILDVNFEVRKQQSYLIEATCLTSTRERLSACFNVKYE